MLIGLRGYKNTGKDEAAQLLVTRHGFRKYALADPVRVAAERLDPIVTDDGRRLSAILDTYGDWDAAKRLVPEVRRTLQYLGTEVGRNTIDNNVWISKMLEVVEQCRSDDQPLVVSDVRFPDEVDAVRQAGGMIIEIRRDGHGPSEHSSEQDFDARPDVVIYNNGSLKDLAEHIDSLVQEVNMSAPKHGRTFALVRNDDVSGVSGTGIVAYGHEFADGVTVLRWSQTPSSVSVWNSIDDMLKIHGHHGSTFIEFV